MKYIIVALSLLTLAGCTCDSDSSSNPQTKKYIETEFGLYPYSDGYCEFGILTNNSKEPIQSLNGQIPCKGYVELTKEQVESEKMLKDHDFTQSQYRFRNE